MITTDNPVFWDIFTKEIDRGSTVAAAEAIATEEVIAIDSRQQDSSDSDPKRV